MAVAAVISCEKDDTDPNEGGNEEPNTEVIEGITVSNIVPTYNSVTFDVVAEDALAIAYIAVEAGTELTAQDVFNDGEAKGSTQGTFTYKGDGLKSETEYTLYVAAKTADGNIGPAANNFTTEENTGAASSDNAAGIRVESIGTASLIWEVTNGADIDFSITMVQPTILMENDCYEAAKSGISEADYIASVMTYEGNGYLVRETEGAGAVAMYNYSDIYTTYPMYPDARYTIYTLGCKGDYDDLTSVETLELTKLDVLTESIPRIGNPYVEVTLKTQYFNGLAHTLTPNSDTAYWTKFFTQTAELDEFIAYYDRIEGAGAGRIRLKEYIQHADPYVLDQSGASDISMSLGWGYEGINFSRLALGFDVNLMPGDQYGESIAQVLERTGEEGEYEMQVDSIAAGNFRLTTTLKPNTQRVYWKLVVAGSYDAIVADPDAATALAQTLDYEGWVEFRSDAMGQEDFETNKNHDVEYIRHSFVYDQSPATEYQIVSTSLNYGGVLSMPVLSEPFTTLPRTFGNYEPSLTITADQSAISKTNVLVNYQVHDDAYANDERLFYHRFLSADDTIFEMSDDEIREWLLLDNGYENANCWTLVSTDYEHEDKYSYHVNWAGLEPGTNYNYIYCTENGKGEISNLGMTTFTTVSNDGGDNPKFTISVDPESIVVDGTTYSGEVTITPNADVVYYKALFIGETALKSYYYDPDDIEGTSGLNVGLYRLVNSEGLPYQGETTTISSNTFAVSDRTWVVAQGYGADAIQSKLSYVCFESDGTISEQYDYDLSPNWVSAATPAKSATTSPFPAVGRINSNYSDRSMLGSVGHGVVATQKPERRISEAEAAELRAKGIPFYTLRELTRKAILKEELK